MILPCSDVSRVFARAMALWAAVALAAFAQNPRGALRGTVQDPSGARVAGAKDSTDQLAIVDHA